MGLWNLSGVPSRPCSKPLLWVKVKDLPVAKEPPFLTLPASSVRATQVLALPGTRTPHRVPPRLGVQLPPQPHTATASLCLRGPVLPVGAPHHHSSYLLLRNKWPQSWVAYSSTDTALLPLKCNKGRDCCVSSMPCPWYSGQSVLTA